MTELAQTVQAILFAAPEPVSIKTLTEVCESADSDIIDALKELKDALDASGIRLSEHNKTYRLITSPDATAALARYHDQTMKHDLSRPALETLAIIAYQGPITRHAIEEIRGVGSEQMLKNLLQRGLIEESGRSKDPGRPTLYGVSHSFLDTVGIASLSDLPPLSEEAKA